MFLPDEEQDDSGVIVRRVLNNADHIWNVLFESLSV